MKLGLIVSATNVRRLRAPRPGVSLALLERTLMDPPRAAAARRWAGWLRRTLPDAQLVPYAWHLVTHALEDGLRTSSSRTLDGPPHKFGLLQDAPQVEQAWATTVQTASAMGAALIALRTPAGLAPGVVGRARLKAFVARRAAEPVELVWEPQGMWTADHAASQASTLGIPWIWDAFDDPSPGAWLRVAPMLRGGSLGLDQIDALLDVLDARPDATVLFGGPQALRNLDAVRDALLRDGLG